MGWGPSKIAIFKNSNFLGSNGGREFIIKIDHKFHNWKKANFCWKVHITFSLKELKSQWTQYLEKVTGFVFLVTSCVSDIFLCRSSIWWKKFGKKRVQQSLQQAFWTKVAVTIQDITQIQTPPSWCRETLRSSQKAQDTTFYPDQVSGKALLSPPKTFSSILHPMIHQPSELVWTPRKRIEAEGRQSMEIAFFLLFISYLFSKESDVASQWCRIYHTL